MGSVACRNARTTPITRRSRDAVERMPKRHRLTLQLCVWDQIREMARNRRGERTCGGGTRGEREDERSTGGEPGEVRPRGACPAPGSPAALKVVNFGGESPASPRARNSSAVCCCRRRSRAVETREGCTRIFRRWRRRVFVPGRVSPKGAGLRPSANAGERGERSRGPAEGARTSSVRGVRRETRGRGAEYTRGVAGVRREVIGRGGLRGRSEPSARRGSQPCRRADDARLQNVTRNGTGQKALTGHPRGRRFWHEETAASLSPPPNRYERARVMTRRL